MNDVTHNPTCSKNILEWNFDKSSKCKREESDHLVGMANIPIDHGAPLRGQKSPTCGIRIFPSPPAASIFYERVNV